MTNNLLAELRDAPAMPNAACIGLHALFDEASPDETPLEVDKRHARALMLCRSCPTLAACQQWFATLKPSKKPPGVIACTIHAPKQPKAGRPRKAAS
jgi:WhiB family redox-sensing transcriptional regulator